MRSIFGYYDPGSPLVLPPHKVMRPEQVSELMKNMAHYGWRGESLIGYRLDDGAHIQLLSGTHRHDAARQLRGLNVIVPLPIHVYPHSFVMRCFGRLRRWQCLMQGKL